MPNEPVEYKAERILHRDESRSFVHVGLEFSLAQANMNVYISPPRDAGFVPARRAGRVDPPGLTSRLSAKRMPTRATCFGTSFVAMEGFMLLRQERGRQHGPAGGRECPSCK